MSISLKLQQAWEIIMLKYGKHYDDACMIRTGMWNVAADDLTLSAHDVANIAIAKRNRMKLLG